MKRSETTASAAAGTVPPGQRIYAIGDIHGRLDLLELLIDQIEADDMARGQAETHIIFLGDLVDRGPASADVVELALQISRKTDRARFLLGNHEEVFLKAVHGDLKALAFFTRIGGRETILSYGVSEEAYLGAEYPELLAMFQERVPTAHIAFLESFEDLIVFGDYAFVHAGLHPDAPLARQKPKDLRWIRNEFLNHRGPFEKIVVHGHTISEEVEIRSHRIGLDTGAFASGKLTAMGFEGGDYWALQATIQALA
ncbi:metallophosphoesterase family protein [Sphingomonas sp.]|uniref:metallophosphoesterase family protein n=1 Tax=Sphingomonas sp. TaxID=28214 RepID=UPI0025D78219|nr:metallophosphoesterase family protein [Sphingomonas sp.]